MSHGRVRYVAAWLTHSLHRTLLQQAARKAGVVVQALPEGLRTRRRGGVTFAFNFGATPQRAPVPSNAEFLLGEAQLATGDVCAWVEA